MRKNRVSTQYIVDLHVNNRLSARQIAPLVGISRQAVWKRLRAAGINLHDRVWIDFTCSFCGVAGRKRWKVAAKNEDNYCSRNCYAADLENPGYKQWRNGSRIAIAIVSEYFTIPEGAIVHHKDGNDRNNDRANLMVLASQADHIRIHRTSKTVIPLWDGSTI